MGALTNVSVYKGFVDILASRLTIVGFSIFGLIKPAGEIEITASNWTPDQITNTSPIDFTVIDCRYLAFSIPDNYDIRDTEGFCIDYTYQYNDNGYVRTATRHGIFCKTTTSISYTLKNQIVFDISNLKVSCKFENSGNVDYARSSVISHRHETDHLNPVNRSYDLHDGNTINSIEWYSAFNEALPNSLIDSEVGRNDVGGVTREIDVSHFGVINSGDNELLTPDSINSKDPAIATREILKCPAENYYYSNGKIRLLGFTIGRDGNYQGKNFILEKDGVLHYCPIDIFLEYITNEYED